MQKAKQAYLQGSRHRLALYIFHKSSASSYGWESNGFYYAMYHLKKILFGFKGKLLKIFAFLVIVTLKEHYKTILERNPVNARDLTF